MDKHKHRLKYLLRLPSFGGQFGLLQAKNAVTKLIKIANKFKPISDINKSMCDGMFLAALKDDLNTPLAIARLHELAHIASEDTLDSVIAADFLRQSLQFLGFTCNVDQIAESPNVQQISPQEIEVKISQRNVARKNRDFALADTIRDELLLMGVSIEDLKESTKWKYLN